MTMKTTCALLAALLVASCATPEMLKKQSTAELCSSYRRIQTADARNELVQRHAFSDAEWTLIDAKQIKIGMSEDALICSWGNPSGWGDINRRVSTYGISKQYVYRACRTCSASYVYIRDGKINSWSD